VTPETRKMGRSVTHIRFKIEDNPQLAILDIDDGAGVRNSPTYAALIGQGVSDRLAKQWIAEHGAEYVAKKLAYVGERRDVQNPVSYLQAALRDDYAAPVVEAAPTSERGRKLAIVRDLVAGRSPTQRDADKRLFMARLDGAARLDFEKHGWMSALNAEAIFAFWEELMPGTFEQ